MVTAVTIDIHDVKETVVRKGGSLSSSPFVPGLIIRGLRSQVDKSLLEIEKALVYSGFLLGDDFCWTFDKNKQEDSHASGNCPPSTLGTGLFLPRLGSDLGRKRLRPRRGPTPIVAPPPAQPGMLSGPGRAGRFAWPPAVAGAGSARGRWVLSPRLGPFPAAGSREVTCGSRLLRSHRADCGDGRTPPGLASGERAGPPCSGCESFGRPSEWPHSEGGAGRARPAEKTRAGQAGGGASRTFVRVESPPRGPGLCGRPRPQHRLLRGDVYLVCGVRSRRVGGSEFWVRGTSRGAGERQDVRQGRGRQGERLRGRQGRSRANAAARPRRARAPRSSPRATAQAPGAAAGGPGWLEPWAARSPAGGRAEGGDPGGGGRRAELRSGAGASQPASVPGSGSRRAAGGDAQQVRLRQTRRQEWVLPTLRVRLRRAGGRGLGCHLRQAGSCRLWRSGWSPAKPCSFDLMSLSVVCARQ